MNALKDCKLIGRWRIVAADIWERDYLDLCGPAMLDIRADGHGEIAFGAFQASLDLAYGHSTSLSIGQGSTRWTRSEAPGRPNSSKTAPWRSNSIAITATTLSSKPNERLVVALVGDQPVGVGQVGQHGRRAAIVADLALGEQQDQRLALAVADRVQFRVQAALGSSDAAGNSPFLRRLAAVRCALRCVASIITMRVASLPAARAAKILSNTPARLQRTKRLYKVLCGP